jgi:hypothetical protein
MIGEFYNPRGHKAEATADSAASKATSLQDEVTKLGVRFNRLLLLNQALWELLKERTGLEEQDVLAKVTEIDQRDGKIDGKMGISVMDCPACGQKTNSKRSSCLMCGYPMAKQHLFEL